ncbi:MAG TPA: glycine zipper 2TM domain-containing protein [Nevskiaceae bacterium]|nr:glycine zipper 2TM domain-containing protein [Nevskiaceae bacterium]
MRTGKGFVVVALSAATILAACQKAEQAAPSITISVSPTSVKAGESANLTWSATNATACTASGTWSGTQPLSGSQQVTTSSAGANAYTLMCNGPGGSAANTATLAIAEAPKVAEHRAERAELASAEGSSRRAQQQICPDCGKVTAITPVKQKGEASGMGAVGGAVLGAIIGHQFGSGRGNSAATAGGAIAGGVGGYEAEKAIRSKTVYKVQVAMDDGSTRNVTLATQEGLFIGAKVRVVGNDVELRD